MTRANADVRTDRVRAFELQVISSGYRLSGAIGAHVPLWFATPAARIVGRICALTMPRHRRLVERHQTRAGRPKDAAELDRLVVGAFQSYCRYWYELFRLPHDARSSLEARVTSTGFEYIEESQARGNGTILALPHIGGWEYAGAWLAARGYPPVVVAESVEPVELFDWFVEQRHRFGMDVIALGPESGGEVAKALRSNRVVCLLCDRDLTGDGVEVDFFDERTTLPGGPALLALRTGATLLPVASYYEPDGRFFIVIGPPLVTGRNASLRDDVARITQHLAHRFEALIRRAPEQWHLMQPNWPGDGEAP